MKEKKEMSALRMALNIIGAIVLIMLMLFAVCGYVFSKGVEAVEETKVERQKKIESDKKELQARLEECSKSEVVSVKDVMAMAEQNEAKLANMWKGSCVHVSGKVKSVDEGIMGETWVHLNDGKKFSFQGITCKPSSTEKAFDLVAGQLLRVYGFGGNEIAGSFVIDHCDWKDGE